MSIERDLLARMQQKLTATLAQVRTLLERRQFADASRLLGDSYYALFGLDRRFLQMMKPPQVVTVMGSLEKVRAFAELMAEEAELLRLQGDAPSAVATARWTAQIIESAKLEAEVGALLARLRALSDLLFGP
jgi:hypothetical protein